MSSLSNLELNEISGGDAIGKDYVVDVMGVGSAEYGPDTGGGTRYNIDDPKYNADDNEWGNTEGLPWGRVFYLSLQLPPLKTKTEDCLSKCKGNEKERRRKCQIVRNRVAAAMKRAGCPSKVEATHKK